MKQTFDTRREGLLAGFIFILWLMAVVFPPLQINIFTPAIYLGVQLYWITAAYLVLNGFAFLYALYMLAVLFKIQSHRKKLPGNFKWRMALYLYAVVGLSIAIYTAAQSIF